MSNSANYSAETAFSDFERQFAFTWAHAQLVDYLHRNPKASIEEKQEFFSASVESGLSLALEFSKPC